MNKIFFRYWFLVLRRSWSDVWGFLGIKVRILNVLVIGTVAVLMYLGNTRIPWLKEAQNELLIALLAAILFMPVLTLLNLIFVPPKIHDELAGFDRLKLRTHVENEPPQYGETWVSLRIFNDHPTKTVSSCSAFLKSVTSEKDGTSILKRVGERLAWSSDNPPVSGVKEIPPNENCLINLLCTLHSADRIMFTTQEENDSHKEKASSGEYLVVVGVVGDFSGKPFEREKTIRITYTGDKNISYEEVD